ncbi:hypothetical protein PPYR_10426, partial [Photinus pyralis]
IVIVACLVVCASAKPWGWGHGHHLPLVAHGHDDGQWHGEGLVESQDWAGRAEHLAGVHGHGLVHGHGFVHGHGALIGGHAGAIVTHAHHGAILGHHGHW